VDVQPNVHVVPAVGLGFGVAGIVGIVGGVGTTHPVWHVAAWALQVIMQLVTIDVCASRILPSANALCTAAALIAAAARRIAKRRMRPPTARILVHAS
jgi:hypothetical protein